MGFSSAFILLAANGAGLFTQYIILMDLPLRTFFYFRLTEFDVSISVFSLSVSSVPSVTSS